MSKEVFFEESEVLLSTTDLDSRIKYANANFCQVAGYANTELEGSFHNMVRHQHMPKAAFADLWQNIQSGKSWMGPVKNRCKNGDYYWVNAFVTPIKDEKGNTYEYQSVRTKPNRTVVNRAEKVYQQLNANQTPFKLKFQLDQTRFFAIAMMLINLLAIAELAITKSFSPITLILFVLSLVLTVFFFNWRKQYLAVVGEAKKVFNNPLMSYLYSGSNDDLSAVNLALKMRGAELNAVVGRVDDDAGVTTNSAEQSAGKCNEVATILDNQKIEIEQVATAINQMALTIQEIAGAVTQASTAAAKGSDLSLSGQSNVTKTISAIEQLSKQLDVVSGTVSNLVSGTRSIESVLAEISGIADQTNLLALNAAIEAARAGEQGRGFAVVAEEVRALAMRTQQSTEEINNLLAQLRSDSDHAIDAVNVGNELSNTCVNAATETGASLEHISDEVTELAAMSTQIAAAVEEQSVVTEQVNQNVVVIAQMSAQSEQLGKEAQQLSHGLLARLAEQQALVSQFQKQA